MKKSYFLYLIVLLEGYIVLSTELIAIRQIVPYVGSGTITTSIVIAAVLLPLAVGYYWGGRFKPKINLFKRRTTVRKKLLFNILTSTIILTIGLSYVLVYDFFTITTSLFKGSAIIISGLYCLFFIIYPVFLLAQTIPLVLNYFDKDNISLITGKMLFFSTIGSLAGALFSTLFLMSTIGVNLTASVTIGCLCFLYIFIIKNKKSKTVFIMIGLFALSLLVNKPSTMEKLNVIENNAYHMIELIQGANGLKVLKMNNGLSAGINARNEMTFPYMKHIENTYIKPIQKDGPRRNILVIGAGGFTLGLSDKKNDYTFIDIDDSLKDVSEQYFLKQKLGENKKFKAVPVRAYLQQLDKDFKFDLIIVDTYLGTTIPLHLVTKEFFESVKARLKPNGVMAMNHIGSTTFNDEFSLNFNETLRSVFPFLSRQVMGRYNGWNTEHPNYQNIIYSYHHKSNYQPKIYTDDLNNSTFDKDKLLEE